MKQLQSEKTNKMKYYKIKIKRIFDKENKVLGHANWEFVPNTAFYFDSFKNQVGQQMT